MIGPDPEGITASGRTQALVDGWQIGTRAIWQNSRDERITSLSGFSLLATPETETIIRAESFVAHPAGDGSAPMTLTLSSQPMPDLLDRHQHRREQSIPTVSLLCGQVGLGMRRWQGWAARRDVPVVTLSTTDFVETVSAWVRSLTATRDLIADAIGWLAHVTGQEPEDLRRRTTTTGNDFEWFWRDLAISPDNACTAGTCRLILTEAARLDCQPLLQANSRSVERVLEFDRCAGNGQPCEPGAGHRLTNAVANPAGRL